MPVKNHYLLKRSKAVLRESIKIAVGDSGEAVVSESGDAAVGDWGKGAVSDSGGGAADQWNRSVVARWRVLSPISCVILILFASFSAQAICVRGSVAYLRKSATTKSEKTWVVGKYMPLKKQSQKGNWIRVTDVDGEGHWVHANNVTKAIRCVVVKSPYAHLRTGPGKSYPKSSIEVADKYTPFKKLKRKNRWTQVEDDYGKKFWILSSHLWEPVITQRIVF